MELVMKGKTASTATSKKVFGYLCMFVGFVFEGILLTGSVSGLLAAPMLLFPILVCAGVCISELS
ncbi:MAG: hypothetical protein Q4E65_08620 [Clostridia bacterium]|nr:hypothetical protein [Clostridia bacterium]